MSQRGVGRSSGGHRKRMAVSYTIRDVKEPLNRAGVNAMAIDPAKKLLYTAGRDAIIRCWDISEAHGQKQCVSQTDYSINEYVKRFIEFFFCFSNFSHT